MLGGYVQHAASIDWQDKLALDKKAALILHILGLVGHSKSAMFSAAFLVQGEASIAQPSPHNQHLFLGCESQAQHNQRGEAIWHGS
jgi:hypothetical protein